MDNGKSLSDNILPEYKTKAQEHDSVILPCPCCGARAEFKHTDVYCTECGLRTGIRFRLWMAIKVWNNRKPNSVLCDGDLKG